MRNDGAVFTGFFWGVVIGGIIALLRGPRLNPNRHNMAELQQELRGRIEAVIPGDPIAESIAEGKAAARRRLTEMTDSAAHPRLNPPQ